MLPILLLCETWMCSSDSNNFLPFHNSYVIYRADREDGQRGGGVAILIPKIIPSMPIFNKKVTNDFEAVWCKLTAFRKAVNIGLVYRPPRRSHENMPKFNRIFER